jgi:hypothetical protein
LLPQVLEQVAGEAGQDGAPSTKGAAVEVKVIKRAVERIMEIQTVLAELGLLDSPPAERFMWHDIRCLSTDHAGELYIYINCSIFATDA